MSEKDPLLEAMASITKQYGPGAVIDGNETVPTKRVSTGSYGLDAITGGGWPLGRIIELIGPESSGKTTLSIHGMIESQKAFPDKKIAIIDVEHAFDKTYAEKLGLDMSRVIFSQPDSGEQALEIADRLIESGKISLCMIDSVAALTPQAELEGEMEDNQMGLQARLMSKGCRKLKAIVNKTDTVLIFTNQIRLKIGGYGNPETTPGGNALKFYASIRVDIRKSQGEKDGETVLTSHVTCKTIKNKTAAPFQKCEFEIRFGEGIDTISELVTWAVNLGVIKKAGSWYSYGETKLGQGLATVIELFKKDEALLNEIKDNINEANG